MAFLHIGVIVFDVYLIMDIILMANNESKRQLAYDDYAIASLIVYVDIFDILVKLL